MLRMNARYLTAVVGLLVCAGSAKGDLSAMYVESSLFNIAQISYEDGVYETDIHADAQGRFLSPETGFGFVHNEAFESRVEFGQQSAMARSAVDLKTDSDGFEFTTNMSSEAMLGESGIHSGSQVETNIRIVTSFDTDTELEIFFRIDFENTGFTGQFAAIGLHGAGIDNPEFSFLAANDPLTDGYVEASFRSTALANEEFTLEAQLLAITDTDSGFDTIRLGEMAMHVELRAVPTPAGLFVLGGLGMIVSRRRR